LDVSSGADCLIKSEELRLLCFVALAYVANPWLFAIVLCYILLCYGGGFGTMPSFISDVFGTKNLAVVYGTVLTAWSAAGIVGPQMVALLKDNFKDTPAMAAKYTFLIGACILTFGFLVTLISNNKPFEKK